MVIDLAYIKSFGLTIQENKNKKDGLYISPSNNEDVTGKYLSSINNEGKVEWKDFGDYLDLGKVKDVNIENCKTFQTLVCQSDGTWKSDFNKLSHLEDVDVFNIKNNSVLTWKGNKWIGVNFTGVGIKNINGQSGVFQLFSIGDSGSDFEIISNNDEHIFNIPTASSTSRGLVSNTDWQNFNSKLSGTIEKGHIYIGDTKNISTPRQLHGDIKMSDVGFVELSDTSVVPGVYVNSNIKVDSKGRIIDISSGDKYIKTAVLSINGSLHENHIITNSEDGNDFSINTDNKGHTYINLPFSSSTSTGKLSYLDWSIFNDKMNNSLLEGNIWIGNNANTPEQVIISGDIKLEINGVATLNDTGVIPGTYNEANVTVDSKGRITNIREGDTFISPITPGLYKVSDITVDKRGRIINIKEGDIGLKTAIISINELESKNHNIVVSEEGTDVNISSFIDTTTINIPAASKFSSGKLLSSDWNKFNNKMNNILPTGNIFIGDESNIPQFKHITGDISIGIDGVSELIDIITPNTITAATVTTDSKGRIVSIESSIESGISIGDIVTWNGSKFLGNYLLKFNNNLLEVYGDIELKGGDRKIKGSGDIELTTEEGRVTILGGVPKNGNFGDITIKTTDSPDYGCGEIKLETGMCIGNGGSSILLTGSKMFGDSGFNIYGGVCDESGESPIVLSSIIGTSVTSNNSNNSGDIIISGGVSGIHASVDGGSLLLSSGKSLNTNQKDGDVIIDIGNGKFITKMFIDGNIKHIYHPETWETSLGSLLKIESSGTDFIKLGWEKLHTLVENGFIINKNGSMTSLSLITSPMDGFIKLNGLKNNTTHELSINSDSGISINAGYDITINTDDNDESTGSKFTLHKSGKISLIGGVNKYITDSDDIEILGGSSMSISGVTKAGNVIISGGSIDVEGVSKRAGDVIITSGGNSSDGNNGNVIITASSDGIGRFGDISFITCGIEYKMPSYSEVPPINRPLSVHSNSHDVVSLGICLPSYISSYLNLDTLVANFSSPVLEFDTISLSSGITLNLGIFTLLPNNIYNIQGTFSLEDIAEGNVEIALMSGGSQVGEMVTVITSPSGTGVFHGIYDTYGKSGDNLNISFNSEGDSISFLLKGKRSFVTITPI